MCAIYYFVQSKFGQGNVIIFESHASGKSIRIDAHSDQVDGKGGNGTWAQFIVHVRGPGLIALQSVHRPDNWLGIIDGKLIGTVRECVQAFWCVYVCLVHAHAHTYNAHAHTCMCVYVMYMYVCDVHVHM